MIELLLLLMVGGVEQQDTVNYELVFSTSWQKCNDRNHEAMVFYNSLIQKYLKLNGLNGVAKHISCKNVADVFPTYPLKSDVELTIIIPDWIQSNFYAVTYGHTGVHYGNQDGNVIISTSLAYSSKNPASVWTLSHELMHFVIYHKGYDLNLQEDYVHDLEKKVRACGNYSYCSNYWSVIDIGGEPYTVMKPLIIPEQTVSSTPKIIPVKEVPQTIGKIGTDISATINNKVRLDISSTENICFKASLHEIGTGNPISNKPMLFLYTFDNAGNVRVGSKIVYTDYNGMYENCDVYGSSLPTSWEFWFKYQGNDNYYSSKSSIVTMRSGFE